MRSETPESYHEQKKKKTKKKEQTRERRTRSRSETSRGEASGEMKREKSEETEASAAAASLMEEERKEDAASVAAAASIEAPRVLKHPYRDRTDIGMLGVLTGHYSGCDGNRIEIDLEKAPAFILMLQRVTANMLKTLREERSLPDGGAEAGRKLHQWKQVLGHGEDGRVFTLAVLGRDPAVESMKKVVWKEVQAEASGQRPITFMIVECGLASWAQPNGLRTLAVANVDVPLCASYDTVEKFLTMFAAAASKYNVRVVGGNFGMALWRFGPKIEAKGVRVDLAAWRPWVDPDGPMRCLSDTTGMFLLGGCASVKPLFPHTAVTSAITEIPDVPRFRRHGFQFCEFLGCMNEQEAQTRLATHRATAVHVQPELPQCVQKRVRFGEEILEAGGHEPLLVYLGRHSNRSSGALARREHTRRRRQAEQARRHWAQKAGKGWQPRGTVGQGYEVPPWRETETKTTTKGRRGGKKEDEGLGESLHDRGAGEGVEEGQGRGRVKAEGQGRGRVTAEGQRRGRVKDEDQGRGRVQDEDQGRIRGKEEGHEQASSSEKEEVPDFGPPPHVRWFRWFKDRCRGDTDESCL